MIRDYYTTSFSVYRETETTGSYSQPIVTSSLLQTGSCYIEALSGNERVVNSKQEVYADYVLITDVADIKEADTIICNSITYDVRFVDNVKNHHLEILLSKRV